MQASSTVHVTAPRSGMSAAFEPIFTSVLAGSFFVHAAMTLVFFQVEAPPVPQNADIVSFAKRVRSATIPIPPPPRAPSSPVAHPPPDALPVAKRAPARRKRIASTSASSKPLSAAARRKQIGDNALIALLSTPGAMGAAGDVFAAVPLAANLSTDVLGTQGVRTSGGVTRRGPTGPAEDSFVPGLHPELRTGASQKLAQGPKKRPTRAPPAFEAEPPRAQDGQVDGREVARVIRGRRSAFMQCYDRALKDNAKLAGKLRVEFVIAENGRVADATTLGAGLGAPALDRCVAGVVRRLRFAPRSDDVTVVNSFVFTPSR